MDPALPWDEPGMRPQLTGEFPTEAKLPPQYITVPLVLVFIHAATVLDEEPYGRSDAGSAAGEVR